MSKLLCSQVIVLSVLTLFAYLLCGERFSLSVFLGGFSYVLPTILAVSIIKILQPYPEMAGVAFLGSVSLKVVFALILMVGVFIAYPQLHFLSFFVGLLAVSHLVFLFFLKVYRYGK